VRTDNLRSRLPGKRTEPDEAKCGNTRPKEAAKGDVQRLLSADQHFDAPAARGVATSDRF
jgi:hypothetical protein